LENFVTSFKERQLLETELLSDEMHHGSTPKLVESGNESEDNEDDTYDGIISRFRFVRFISHINFLIVAIDCLDRKSNERF